MQGDNLLVEMAVVCRFPISVVPVVILVVLVPLLLPFTVLVVTVVAVPVGGGVLLVPLVPVVVLTVGSLVPGRCGFPFS